MTQVLPIILSIIVLGGIPFSFADSERDDKLEFAGTLEETLGHFWALELNLDEKNSNLALVHATHPIAELYETMNAHLQDNPEFDLKLQETLMNLQYRANTDVSREEAQVAIDEAKQIIQEARLIIVGEELSDDPTFKMQSIMVLLETSKVEYEEAIVDGMINEMAEFQDGSAFVWRSQEIYRTLNEIDPIDSSRIDGYYTDVWNLFEQQADTQEVKNSIDLVISEFEELSGIDSVPSEHEEMLVMDLPPLKQIKEGVEPQDITCKPGMKIIFKYSGSPACVNSSSVEKLVQRGWKI